MRAAVILAGGQSIRMGTDKSLLKFKNVTLQEHAKSLLKKAKFQSIFVSGKDGIRDIYQDKGPLAGVLASLKYLQNYKYVLFIPVDMPLLTNEIILNLIKQKPASVCVYENYNLPLFIKNTRTNREIIENQINQNHLSIYQLLNILKVQRIENNYSKAFFINTNTPEQWQEFTQSLQE